jgi:hypothetical protein
MCGYSRRLQDKRAYFVCTHATVEGECEITPPTMHVANCDHMVNARSNRHENAVDARFGRLTRGNQIDQVSGSRVTI